MSLQLVVQSKASQDQNSLLNTCGDVNNRLTYKLYEIPDIKLYRVDPLKQKSYTDVDRNLVFHSSSSTSKPDIEKHRVLIGGDVNRHLLSSSHKSKVDKDQNPFYKSERAHSLEISNNTLQQYVHNASQVVAKRIQLSCTNISASIENKRKRMIEDSNDLRTSTALHPETLTQHVNPRSDAECVEWVLADAEFNKSNLENNLFKLEKEIAKTANEGNNSGTVRNGNNFIQRTPDAVDANSQLKGEYDEATAANTW